MSGRISWYSGFIITIIPIAFISRQCIRILTEAAPASTEGRGRGAQKGVWHTIFQILALPFDSGLLLTMHVSER